MLVNQENIEDLNNRLNRQKEILADAEEQIKKAKGNSDLLEILERVVQTAKGQIRMLKRGIEWENTRYDYLTGWEEKLKELSPYLGKEVKTFFRSDKDKPQILLGLKWKDGTPNYSSSNWVGVIKYWLGGRVDEGETALEHIKPVHERKRRKN